MLLAVGINPKSDVTATCSPVTKAGLLGLGPAHATGMCRPRGFESPVRTCRMKKGRYAFVPAPHDLAESWGFEPQKGVAALTRLAGERLQPLGHPFKIRTDCHPIPEWIPSTGRRAFYACF